MAFKIFFCHIVSHLKPGCNPDGMNCQKGHTADTFGLYFARLCAIMNGTFVKRMVIAHECEAYCADSAV